MDIQSCIAGRGAGMVGKLIAYRNPSNPSDPRLMASLGEVKRDHLAGEKSGFYPCLLSCRRTAAKYRVKLYPSAVKILSGSDSVGCLAGGKQGRANDEHLAVSFRFGSLGFLLREADRRKKEQRQKDALNKSLNKSEPTLPYNANGCRQPPM